MMKLLAAVLVASLVSLIGSANTSDTVVCSAIVNTDCQCTNSSSAAASSVDVRCTFNTPQAPSQPLFANSSFVLDTLDLSGNRLDNLPEGFFNNETVDTLILRNNSFLVVPKALGNMRAVRVLDLSSNKFTALSSGVVAGVQELQNLRELDLSGNDIESITDDAFDSLTGLTRLNLAHNRLTQVTRSTFSPLGLSLQTLDLSHNNLKQVDRLSFQQLQRVHMLSLAGNNVEHVLGSLRLPEHVTRLDLSDCGLTSISRCQLSRLEDLDVLELRGNPLNCTCELYQLQQWLKNQGSEDSQWRCQTSGDGGQQVAVDDLSAQCQDSYTVCPSVDELISQMAMTIDVEMSGDTLSVSWTLQADDALSIDGFQLRYLPEIGDRMTSPVVPPDQRRLSLDTGDLADHYTVCLEVLMYTSAVVHQQCRSFQEDSGSVVVGILAGVIFLVPCAVILAYVFVKDNRISKAKYHRVVHDVEKQDSGFVAVAAGLDEKPCHGEAEKSSVGQPCVSVREGADGVDEAVVHSAVVGEMYSSHHTQGSEAVTAKQQSTSQVHFAAVAAVPVAVGPQDSKDPASDGGVQNLGYECQGRHAGNGICTNPEHESTDL